MKFTLEAEEITWKVEDHSIKTFGQGSTSIHQGKIWWNIFVRRMI